MKLATPLASHLIETEGCLVLQTTECGITCKSLVTSGARSMKRLVLVRAQGRATLRTCKSAMCAEVTG